LFVITTRLEGVISRLTVLVVNVGLLTRYVIYIYIVREPVWALGAKQNRERSSSLQLNSYLFLGAT